MNLLFVLTFDFKSFFKITILLLQNKFYLKTPKRIICSISKENSPLYDRCRSRKGVRRRYPCRQAGMGRGRPGRAVTWSGVGGRLQCGVRSVAIQGRWRHRALSLSSPRRHIPRTARPLPQIHRTLLLYCTSTVTRSPELTPLLPIRLKDL